MKRGSENEKVEPLPLLPFLPILLLLSLLVAQMCPCIRLTKSSHRCNPSPVPEGCPTLLPPRVRVGCVSSWEKRRKSRSAWLGVIPGPISEILKTSTRELLVVLLPSVVDDSGGEEDASAFVSRMERTSASVLLWVRMVMALPLVVYLMALRGG